MPSVYITSSKAPVSRASYMLIPELPAPWGISYNIRVVREEMLNHMFLNVQEVSSLLSWGPMYSLTNKYYQGVLKQSFVDIWIALSWGSAQVKASNFWTLPGSRFPGRRATVGSCANAGTVVNILTAPIT